MKPRPHDTCTKVILAQDNSAQVELCTNCRTITVQFGPMSIRFDPATLRRLNATIGDALDCANEIYKSLERTEQNEAIELEGFSPNIPRGSA